MAKYLVTGGAGFIGSHLVPRLLGDGHKVVVIDKVPWNEANNLFGLSSPSLEYVENSVSNTDLLKSLVENADQIYLIAATLGVRRVIENPIGTVITQFDQVREICSVAKSSQKVFYASTSEVYGKTTVSPLTEDLPLVFGEPAKARWAYACSKLMAEYMLLSLFRDKKVPVVIGRFFNVVGPRQNQSYGAVIPNFLSQALKGIPLTIYGDGTQTRSFCHVTDAVDAILAIMGNDKCIGHVFNIGTEDEISILALAQKIKKLVNPSLGLRFVPYEDAMPKGFEEILHRVPSVNKIRQYTGWSNKLDLDEILSVCLKALKGVEV